MKNSKSRRNYSTNDQISDEWEEPIHTSHKKDSHRRRPTRNWKKAWSEHQSDYDLIDDFYSK